jgi:hypothetical protein
MFAFLCPFAVFSFIEIIRFTLSLAQHLLNRAKGPAGLTREGQLYTFWGCGKVRDSTKFFLKFGMRDEYAKVRYADTLMRRE